MNIPPVKSLACFKINSESLEVSWDLGVTREVRSISTTPVCTQRQDSLEFTIHPLSSPTAPTCLQLDHLSPSILRKSSLTLPQHGSWRGSQCNANPSTEKSVLIVVTSQLFFQSFVVILSETIHKSFLYVECLLCRTWRRTWTWLLKYWRSGWGQVAFPSLFRSPLHITMICEWTKVTLLLLLKTSGSNHHFTANHFRYTVYD